MTLLLLDETVVRMALIKGRWKKDLFSDRHVAFAANSRIQR